MQNLFKLSKLNGYCMYSQMGDLNTFCPESSCMCVLYMSWNKQRIWLYTALTDFVDRDGECLLRGTNWVFEEIG
jgi:hypothetical protein